VVEVTPRRDCPVAHFDHEIGAPVEWCIGTAEEYLAPGVGQFRGDASSQWFGRGSGTDACP